jgi:hypothetical protein
MKALRCLKRQLVRVVWQKLRARVEEKLAPSLIEIMQIPTLRLAGVDIGATDRRPRRVGTLLPR